MNNQSVNFIVCLQPLRAMTGYFAFLTLWLPLCSASLYSPSFFNRRVYLNASYWFFLACASCGPRHSIYSRGLARKPLDLAKPKPKPKPKRLGRVPNILHTLPYSTRAEKVCSSMRVLQFQAFSPRSGCSCLKKKVLPRLP